jgi:hypothetical protein
MSRWSRLLCAVAVVVAMPAMAGEETTKGRITDTDREDSSFTVQTDDGGQREFRVGESTIVRKDGQTREYGDIATGDRVQVTAESGAGAMPVASRVDVLEGSASADPGVTGSGSGGVEDSTTEGDTTTRPDEPRRARTSGESGAHPEND